MTAPAHMRARMSRPLDAMRVAARAKALTILAADHWPVYVRRCERQGYPVTTTPSQLARWEIANEMQGEM